MKKLILTFSLIVFGTFTYAQSTLDNALKAPVAQMKTAKTVQDFDNLFATFSSLTTSNDAANRWKAYYYAGMAQYKKGELLINSGNKSAAIETNAMAYKFVAGGVPATNADGKKLLDLISLQRKKISN